VAAVEVAQAREVVAVTVGAVATAAARVKVAEWAMAPATPTLTPPFHLIVLNRSLQDTKEQITMAEGSAPAVTPDFDTRAEKALPPGIELNVDRGKALPPGIESKVETVTPDVDTAAEKALPPGIELNVDRDN
jgi:hypothetical protein